jgi:MFS family permease
VLADSSVVVLALPDILAAFHTSIDSVAWVITGFNLALAIAAVPAAYAALRLGPGRVALVGLVSFAIASAVCAAAGSFDLLLAARCVQAVCGAAVVCSALALLPALVGSEARAVTVWAGAAAAGAAVGPALGGALTQAFSWRGVFAAQVPLALAPLPWLWRRWSVRVAAAAGHPRPRLGPNFALGLISAALTAALFLLVLMLVRGWGLSPLAAAGVVTVIPASAIALAFVPREGDPRARAAAGAILVAGGLAALALLPSARIGWTLPPQLLIGAGLALTLADLTRAALGGAGSQTVHGGWTIAFRHAGVVLGLVILTPIFTSDLLSQQSAAEQSGTALVLDSQLSLTAKLRLGDAIDQQLQRTPNRLPDLGPAFRAQHPSASDRPEYDRLRSALEDLVRRAATHAFSRAFLVAAALALLTVIPLSVGWRRADP